MPSTSLVSFCRDAKRHDRDDFALEEFFNPPKHYFYTQSRKPASGSRHLDVKKNICICYALDRRLPKIRLPNMRKCPHIFAASFRRNAKVPGFFLRGSPRRPAAVLFVFRSAKISQYHNNFSAACRADSFPGLPWCEDLLLVFTPSAPKFRCAKKT